MKRKPVGNIALNIVRQFAPGVTRVSDADSDLHINVTDRDFKSGRKKDHSDCALAVAAKRQEKAASVIVAATTAYVIKGDHAIRYAVGSAARKEIVSFDRGGEFCAGDYVLKAMPKSNRLGAQNHGASGGGNGRSTGMAAKRFYHRTANIREDLHAKR